MTPQEWREVIQDVAASVAFGAAWFCAGVGWAAYRAVGWVDRIRAWAHSVPEGSTTGDAGRQP